MITLPEPIGVMPTRKLPTRRTPMAPLLAVIHLGRCSSGDFARRRKIPLEKGRGGAKNQDHSDTNFQKCVRSFPHVGTHNGQRACTKSGTWDPSYSHSQHEAHIHKLAMVVGLSGADFGHRDEKRSSSDSDDRKDMYR